MSDRDSLQTRAIHTIRYLSADAVQKARSGHPGLPMGSAPIAYTLWTRHLRHNPRNPEWPGRDRFILSGGHGCLLLYSLLYLTGYDLSLDEIKNFRQWGSLTPGHPEYGLTPGVEVTTGPLGQGFANGVGMAIAAMHLAARFNRPGYKVIDQYIYAIVTDGDLMEGVASEAASLAGHLRLGNLIYFYDDNLVSIDGSTKLAFTEDRSKRFEAYGWQVLYVDDGNDVEEIDLAIRNAKADQRPSLIVCKTIIGYGLPNIQGTSKAHSDPPGEDEIRAGKEQLGWPSEPQFYVPQDVLNFYRQAVEKGKVEEQSWRLLFQQYEQEYPELAHELERRLNNLLPTGWEEQLPRFPSDEKGLATRSASGEVINCISEYLPDLMGGSADLTPSNKTWINSSTDFQADTPQGRNLHFGVREHAMGAIVNGMSVFGGIIPFAGTFLTFSDYMRAAIRLSALSHYPSIWVFTHDSIGVGEDGPTHQPVEHLAALRSIPNLVVIRPADANETVAAWRVAVKRRKAPTALALTRQNVPTLDREVFADASGLSRGAYVLADLGAGSPDIILMASGSEVILIVQAAQQLVTEGYNIRLVSFPSWELFAEQGDEYRRTILPEMVKIRIAVEAGVSQGWHRWVGDSGAVISVERFGASAPYKRLFQEYSLTVENVVELSKQLLQGSGS